MPAPTQADKDAAKATLQKASSKIQETIKQLDTTTDAHQVSEIKGLAHSLSALFDVNGVC